jgi:hypothetical protein
MGNLLRRAAPLSLFAGCTSVAGAYENLQVAVYVRAQEVVRMSDPAWLEREWQRIAASVHVEATAVRGTGSNAKRIAIALPAHAWCAFGADGNPL